MRSVHIHRPVTCDDLALAIGVKPFELLGYLITLEVFLAPHEVIDDESARTFARAHIVDLIFRSDDEPPTDSSVSSKPDGSPPDLEGSSEIPSCRDIEDDVK